MFIRMVSRKETAMLPARVPSTHKANTASSAEDHWLQLCIHVTSLGPVTETTAY